MKCPTKISLLKLTMLVLKDSVPNLPFQFLKINDVLSFILRCKQECNEELKWVESLCSVVIANALWIPILLFGD